MKDYPQGTRLYSPLCGEVTFKRICYGTLYCIELQDGRGNICFTKDGRYFADNEDAECMLFPSRENRDWSTFKVEQPKTKFEPFQKVLVRDRMDDIWIAQLYSHCLVDEGNSHFCVGGQFWMYCIPYEGNEHLLGTKDKPTKWD